MRPSPEEDASCVSVSRFPAEAGPSDLSPTSRLRPHDGLVLKAAPVRSADARHVEPGRLAPVLLTAAVVLATNSYRGRRLTTFVR